jgi:hypothetical protein
MININIVAEVNWRMGIPWLCAFAIGRSSAMTRGLMEFVIVILFFIISYFTYLN